MNNILIVEDEMLIAFSIKKMIEKHFRCVGIAKSYEEALPYLHMSTVDVVLIDITLQTEKSGLDLAKVIQNEHQIPIIFLTAMTDEDTLKQIIELKPSAYLAKPVQEANVVTAINLALANIKSQMVQLIVGKKSYTIHLDNFLYAEAENVYSNLFFDGDERLVLRISLPELSKQFPDSHFKRINKSEAINPKKITKQNSQFIYLHKKEFRISSKYVE